MRWHSIDALNERSVHVQKKVLLTLVEKVSSHTVCLSTARLKRLPLAHPGTGAPLRGFTHTWSNCHGRKTIIFEAATLNGWFGAKDEEQAVRTPSFAHWSPVFLKSDTNTILWWIRNSATPSMTCKDKFCKCIHEASLHFHFIVTISHHFSNDT